MDITDTIVRTTDDPLSTAADELSRANAARDRAVVQALLHGSSQRDVARRAGISTHTLRNIMLESGLRFRKHYEEGNS